MRHFFSILSEWERESWRSSRVRRKFLILSDNLRQVDKWTFSSLCGSKQATAEKSIWDEKEKKNNVNEYHIISRAPKWGHDEEIKMRHRERINSNKFNKGKLISRAFFTNTNLIYIAMLHELKILQMKKVSSLSLYLYSLE